MKKIEYLRISITDRCNFRCRYCFTSQNYTFIPHDEILRYEEIVEISKVFKSLGINSARITGGEPLVRKNVEFLISELKRIGIEDISMTTNGFLLKEKVRKLKECGLKRVNVSLDTLDPSKFSFITSRSKGDFYKVIEGIEKSLEEGLNPVKVNVVLIKNFNDNEIENFISFSDKLGIEVRFIELMPVGNSPFSWERFLPVSEVKKSIEENYGKLKPTKTFKKGPATSFKLEGTKAVLGFIPSVSKHFCSQCNRLRLTAEGNLRLCLMRDEEINLKKIIRSPDYSPELLKATILKAIEKKKGIDGISALESYGCKRKMVSIGG